MTIRVWLAIMMALGLTGWWLSPLSPRVPPLPMHVDADAARICRMPPRVPRGGLPLQTAPPRGVAAFRLAGAKVEPLAGFSVEARVLAREDYHVGPDTVFSPTDLALGWGRMRDDAVLAKLRISQSDRWYHYRWQGDPPLPLDEITRSSANMHMIPADERIAARLHDVRPGDRVRIDGWLVQIETNNGWKWTSSLRRDDSGGGACELVYVCELVSE
ncbi:MAG: hypothetical protein ABIP16_07185 [Thermomonas sp.]